MYKKIIQKIKETCILKIGLLIHGLRLRILASSYPDIRRNNKVLVTQGINCERPAELAANTDFLGINKGINYNFDSSIQIIRRHKFR